MRKLSSASSKTSRIKRKPIESSLAASVGYDRKTSVLEIEFNSGAVWQYHDVPESIYRAMVKSPSIGRYFRDCIQGVYSEKRMR